MQSNKSFMLTLTVALISLVSIFYTFSSVRNLQSLETTETITEEALDLEEISITSEVAEIFDKDIATRTPRTGVPIDFIRTLFLPAQGNNLFPSFLYNAKNADCQRECIYPAFQDGGWEYGRHF